jgi:hypothetical protein
MVKIGIISHITYHPPHLSGSLEHKYKSLINFRFLLMNSFGLQDLSLAVHLILWSWYPAKVVFTVVSLGTFRGIMFYLMNNSIGIGH